MNKWLLQKHALNNEKAKEEKTKAPLLALYKTNSNYMEYIAKLQGMYIFICMYLYICIYSYLYTHI
jgi:hypothetical protein